MIAKLKSLFSPKVGLRILLRGNLSAREGLTLQAIVQASNVFGYMQIIPGSVVKIDLEGPRSRLVTLLYQIEHTQIGRGTVILEAGWKPYKGEYRFFRASL